MALKEKFFAMLAKLDSEERKQLKGILDGGTDIPVAQQSAETAPVREKVEPEAVKLDEGEPAEETDEAAANVFQRDEEAPEEESEPEAEEQAETAEQPDEEAGGQIKDEQGQALPVDFQQIIDGLNAKVLALEAENTALKAKTEGAFGLTSRTGELVKNNPLYDDDTSEIHFKK